MVRRLLQGLDQVVPVLRVYGPQGAFAYALKDETGQGGTGQDREGRQSFGLPGAKTCKSLA